MCVESKETYTPAAGTKFYNYPADCGTTTIIYYMNVLSYPLLKGLQKHSRKIWLSCLVAVSQLLIAAETRQAVPVSTQQAQKLWFFPERSSPAEVVALNDAKLGAELNAQILDITARVGDTVAVKAVVVKLDCRDAESRLEAAQAAVLNAKARLQQAHSQLQRAQGLKKDRLISAEDLERRHTEVAMVESEQVVQEAATKQASLQTERCLVRAPFKGIVKERLASIGDLATFGVPLLRLIQIADAEVSTQLRPVEAMEVSKANKLHFIWQDLSYPVRLLRTVSVVDSRTRTMELRLAFTGDAVVPGASGRLKWHSKSPHLPAHLLVKRQGQLGIFVYQQNHARFQPVAAAQEGQPVPVVDLGPETLVITDGRAALLDNDPVIVP